jgi:LPS export ABC transporter protein LptC
MGYIRENRKTIGMIAAGICIMGGIIFWLMQEKGIIHKPHTQVQEVAPHEILNSTIAETKNGKKVWELTADSMIYDKERDVDVVKGIKGTFYQEDGTSMTVTADEGEVYLKNKMVVLTKNPKGVTSDNATLNAEKVTWDNEKQHVIADGKVVITKDDVIAKAEKATMDVAINKAKLEKKAMVQKGEKNQ